MHRQPSFGSVPFFPNARHAPAACHWRVRDGTLSGTKWLGQESCRTKVSRIFRCFVPNFAPNFAPNFPRIFWGLFVLRFVGDGDQKNFHQKSPPFFNAKFPGEHENLFTKFFWRAGKVSIPGVIPYFCQSKCKRWRAWESLFPCKLFSSHSFSEHLEFLQQRFCTSNIASKFLVVFLFCSKGKKEKERTLRTEGTYQLELFFVAHSPFWASWRLLGLNAPRQENVRGGGAKMGGGTPPLAKQFSTSLTSVPSPPGDFCLIPLNIPATSLRRPSRKQLSAGLHVWFPRPCFWGKQRY